MRKLMKLVLQISIAILVAGGSITMIVFSIVGIIENINSVIMILNYSLLLVLGLFGLLFSVSFLYWD